MNAQKELDKLERREEELEREHENLSVTLAAARSAHWIYEGEAGAIFWEAERSGNTKEADQAEAKLARLSLDVKRKEGALKDCEKALTEVRRKIGDAKTPPLRERLKAIVAEAEKIAQKPALTADDWHHLYDLWREGGWLLGEIMNLSGKQGETAPFADPRLAFARYCYGVSEALGWGVTYLERARGIPSAPSPYTALFGAEREYLHPETVESKGRPISIGALIGGIGA